jgi:hypothetical protein
MLNPKINLDQSTSVARDSVQSGNDSLDLLSVNPHVHRSLGVAFAATLFCQIFINGY